MTKNPSRRLLWPLFAALAIAAVIVGTRVSVSQPLPGLVGVVLTLVGSAILIMLPGLAVLALGSRRPLGVASRFGLLLAGSGLAAFLDFWGWVASPTLGRIVAVLLLLGSLGVVVAFRPAALFDDRELRAPFAALLVVALGYIGLAYVQGGLGGARWLSGGRIGDTTLAMSYRFWIAPDNTLPLLFAQRLASHGPLTVPFTGAWHTSDRPPLQTGFTLMLWPLFGLRSFAYELLGTILQALWIPSLWILLRSRGVEVARVVLVVICTAATGAVFVNTVYVWPKMLAGAFVLVALAVVLEEGALILAAVLAALALLAHGGVAFSLLAFVPLVWRLRPSRARVGLALAAAALVYLPWIAYQQFLDPPGNRLLKWQLAGVLALDRHTFTHDLLRHYLHNPFHAFVIDKLLNVERLAVVPSIWAGAAPGWTGFLAAARWAQLTSLLIAIGPLLLSIVGLVSAGVRRSLRPHRPLMLFVLVSILCWVILEAGSDLYDSTIIHQGSYAVLLLSIALAALAATYLPTPVGAWIIAVALVWFVLAWVPGLGFQWAQPGLAVSANWAMITLGVVSLLLLGALFVRIAPVRPRDPSVIRRATMTPAPRRTQRRQ